MAIIDPKLAAGSTRCRTSKSGSSDEAIGLDNLGKAWGRVLRVPTDRWCWHKVEKVAAYFSPAQERSAGAHEVPSNNDAAERRTDARANKAWKVAEPGFRNMSWSDVKTAVQSGIQDAGRLR
jgi:hypothetical protein